METLFTKISALRAISFKFMTLFALLLLSIAKHGYDIYYMVYDKPLKQNKVLINFSI